MDTRLIVRGDDFGISHSCNLAIEDCFMNGVLTSAAIIAPAPWAEEAAAMARAHPEWCVGAHLTTLGEWRGYRWRPVLPHDKVKTIVDEYGFLHQTPDAFFAASAGAIDYDQLEREFMAQADLISNGWGVKLGYADYHYINGNRYNAPEYGEVLRRVAKAYGVPLSGYEGETRFTSIYNSEPGKKLDVFLAALDALEPGLWFSVHHLLQDNAETQGLKYSNVADEKPESTAIHRTAEAAVLTHPAVAERIKALGIQLISYRDIDI